MRWDLLEARQLLATFLVSNTSDIGAGSLRAAITASNLVPGTSNDIYFDIEAAPGPLHDVPAPGFDKITQTWTISITSPLPTITQTVRIDGYSQAHSGVPFLYPGQAASGSDPSYISSTRNSAAAREGNNARQRVIVKGSGIGAGTGFVIDASHSEIRGLIIDGFDVGVSIPFPINEGNLVQGNSIGSYLLYPVDGNSGDPAHSPNEVVLAGLGNSKQGIILNGHNAIVGGTSPQENNIISGNGEEGVWIKIDGTGNLVEGNQIGMVGPSTNGRYFQVGNGADGILNEGSSNAVGGFGTAAGNLISGNSKDGVHIRGAVATRTIVASNLIGLAPGGGYVFGTVNPGNHGAGVRIEDSTRSQIGGPNSSWGNAISSNGGAGIHVLGLSSTINLIENNIIGLVSSGNAQRGNSAEGIAMHSPQNTIGPGNVISGNLLGIGIYGPDATVILVQDNLVGTDATGRFDLGNAHEGILIQDSISNTVRGNAQGSQVISGNNQGVVISGINSTRNLVAGNLIGSDISGMNPLPNAQEGVLIHDALANTVGGISPTALNLISANHWGIRIDGLTASGNLVLGNFIGTDITGRSPLANEVGGVIISTFAHDNTIGGTVGGAGNVIAFNLPGVVVESGIGNSILSNSIFENEGLGIDLGGDGVTLNGTPPRIGANNLQNYPVLAYITSDGTITHIVGTLIGEAGTTYLIQFFTNRAADPSGYGEGEFGFGSVQITAGDSGTATIDLIIASAIAPSIVLTATATNLTTGDTSEFSKAISQSAAFRFTTSLYIVGEAAGSATIAVSRTLSQGAASVQYSTVPGGTGIAGVDYASTSGVLNFAPGESIKTFSVTIIDRQIVGGFKTVNLALSNPSPGAVVDFQPTSVLRIVYSGAGSGALFTVINTNDIGPGSLREAMIAANTTPGANEILFDIPAAVDLLLSVPVPGFDPVVQVWTITPSNPLPIITDTVSIDGYSQAHAGVPFRYPGAVSSAVQSVLITGTVVGGFFSLTTSAPLTVGTTGPIAYNATASQVQNALTAIPGLAGNIAVSGGAGSYTISFQGTYARRPIPDMIASGGGLVGSNTGISVQTVTPGGTAISDPILVSSSPNTQVARIGNNAKIRVVIDGSQTGGGTGFELDAANSTIRGLTIDGFGIGVSIAGEDYSGNLIQGNFIGRHPSYPVDPVTGAVTINVAIVGQGNSLQGIYLNASNSIIGGTNPQEDNVIAGNGLQGIWIDVDGTGNVVEGNQVGIVSVADGRYGRVGNSGEGILVNGSSNTIGTPSAGNLISANAGNGVSIVGEAATRTIVAANLIGLAPGGGTLFGTGNPGNGGNGVLIQGASLNQIGGPNSSWGNAISSNLGSGVVITGTVATGNVVTNNIIGLTAAGSAMKGNGGDGVTVFSPRNTIGPGNVISGNLRGVRISGADGNHVIVTANLIGTDLTGTIDLGNAKEGVRIESGATDNVVQGDAKGSQVISGNNQGVVIAGASSTRNLVAGNLIGSDISGFFPVPNSQEGVAILDAPGNTIGGTLAAARNLISANHWGVRIDGPTASGNLVAGNFIGTDITGLAPLGNELNGVIFSTNASLNTVGGNTAGASNIIAFNVRSGVVVQSGTGDSILSNSIFANGSPGIDLGGDGVTLNSAVVLPGPNNHQNYPDLTTAVSGSPDGQIQGSLSTPTGGTYLIQFFTSLAADPSGHGQGQTLLGSITLIADRPGVFPIAFTPSSPQPSSLWITTTATNVDTGDTSEFSNGLYALPVTVAFESSVTTFDATAGVVLIDVVRQGNNQGAAFSVHYATSNGTGLAGKDYQATSGILAFAPGVSLLSFPVQVFANPFQTAQLVTVNMTLSQPGGGATIAAPSTSILVINSNLSPTLQFGAANYVVASSANFAVVTVARLGGNPSEIVQVNYASAGGTAVPGVDYTPVSGTLEFKAYQRTANFTIPLVPAAHPLDSTTVNLTLSDPSVGAIIGPIGATTLTITTIPITPDDRIPPQVSATHLVMGRSGITALQLSFTKPMNPGRAQDLASYGYFAISAGPDGVFGTPDDRATTLSSAIYQSSTQTVTVAPVSPLPLNAFYRIVVDGLATPLLDNGLTDTSGNVLSGRGDGVPGFPYIVTFGAGTKLKYVDALKTTVTLTLTGGGTMEMFRKPDGDVSSLSLSGTVRGKSTLSGKAVLKRAKTTALPTIQGANGVRIQLKRPPFRFISSPTPAASVKPSNR